MTLGTKQRRFVEMIGNLIVWIYSHGYEATFGDAWAKTGHKDLSNHYIRLAIDLNLFKDGVWQQHGSAHAPLHDYWDSIGGAKRIEGDMNHYALEHEGRR